MANTLNFFAKKKKKVSSFCNAKAAHIFVPRHTIVTGYYGIALAAHVSVRLSSFLFPGDNLSKYQWIFNSVGASILWRSGLGLLMGKFHQFLTELSARCMSIFSFPNENFSKYQWIFTKLGVCIDIVETWFGITDGKISSIFDRVICPQYIRILL